LGGRRGRDVLREQITATLRKTVRPTSARLDRWLAEWEAAHSDDSRTGYRLSRSRPLHDLRRAYRCAMLRVLVERQGFSRMQACATVQRLLAGQGRTVSQRTLERDWKTQADALLRDPFWSSRSARSFLRRALDPNSDPTDSFDIRPEVLGLSECMGKLRPATADEEAAFLASAGSDFGVFRQFMSKVVPLPPLAPPQGAPRGRPRRQT
jgi:hypothetical protein